MEEINEIKLPKGVESISVTQHDDKIVIEFMPKKPQFKNGDFVYEDGRIMIVDKFYENDITYHALIYPAYDLEVVYNRLYAPTTPLSSLSFRHASDVEKQILIDAMKKDGKRWNAEKLCIEDIPKSNTPEQGKLAIFWDRNRKSSYIRLYKGFTCGVHCDNDDICWDNAIKFESQEQFEEHIKQ